MQYSSIFTPSKLTFIVTVILLALSLPVKADTFKVANFSWQPYTEQNTESGGIINEVMRHIFQQAGHDIELVNMPFVRSIKALEKENVDILPALWFTQERDAWMQFSVPYHKNRIVFIKAKDSEFEFTGLESLHQTVVAVIRGYQYNEAMMKDKNIIFSVSDDLQQSIKKVAFGRVDLTLEDEFVVKTETPAALLEKISFSATALEEKPLYITCKKSLKSCQTLISIFNEGYQKMLEDGSYQAILDAKGL